MIESLEQFFRSNEPTLGQREVVNYFIDNDIRSEEEALSATELAQKMDRALSGIGLSLKSLKYIGLINSTGSTRGAKYYLPLSMRYEASETAVDKNLTYDNELTRRDSKGRPAQE